MNEFLIDKKQKKSNILYSWWAYAIFFVICLLTSYFAFNLIDKIKDFEKIEIFVSCFISDFSLEEELETKYKEFGILDVTFTQIDYKSDYFNQSLEINGFENSDLLILPESKLTENNVYKCLTLSETFLDNVYPKTYFINPDNDVCGVQVYENLNPSNSLLKKYFNFTDENYYLVLNKKSKHIGEFNSNSYDSIALDVFKDLLESK